MHTDDLKKRMEILNGVPLRNTPPTDSVPNRSSAIDGLRRKLAKSGAGAQSPTVRGVAPGKLVFARDLPSPGTGARAASKALRTPVTLEEAVDYTLEHAREGPGYCLVTLPARDICDDAEELASAFMELIGHPNGAGAPPIAGLVDGQRLRPESVVFVDLETTGLSATPVFLIGTMECSEDGLVFRQYFARDYSQEISILSAFNDRLASTQMLVSFNGKSFDLPYLRNRAVALGVKMRKRLAHLDLLHEARKLYAGRLPNCKLQTLEYGVCGRSRGDDIPGSEIPAAYHEFVRTADAGKISLILKHNLFDLLTMADLMRRMWL